MQRLRGIDERLCLILVDAVVLDVVIDRLDELVGRRAGAAGVVGVERALLLDKEPLEFVRLTPLNAVAPRRGGDRVAEIREPGLRRSEWVGRWLRRRGRSSRPAR